MNIGQVLTSITLGLALLSCNTPAFGADAGTEALEIQKILQSAQAAQQAAQKNAHEVQLLTKVIKTEELATAKAAATAHSIELRLENGSTGDRHHTQKMFYCAALASLASAGLILSTIAVAKAGGHGNAANRSEFFDSLFNLQTSTKAGPPGPQGPQGPRGGFSPG
jgi:hypothetical protein